MYGVCVFVVWCGCVVCVCVSVCVWYKGRPSYTNISLIPKLVLVRSKQFMAGKGSIGFQYKLVSFFYEEF